MKIFVIGSLNMDLVINAPFAPEQGMTIEGSGFMTNPGGKGANQAVACAKLGGNAYMVGCVGEAFGDELIASLARSGVHTEFVARATDVSSGIAVIVVVDGDNRIILDRAANGRVDKAIIDRALASAEAGDYLVLQLEIGLDSVEYALREGKRRGMVTVLNPAPAAELSEEIFSHCDYLIPNQTEAKFYTDIYPEDEASARACAEKLTQKGVANVIITMGAHGSVYIGGGKYCAVDAYPAVALDTTAAGDTFVGAFVVKYAEGADVEDAMRFASRASAITITRRGAQQSIPTRAEVDAS